ncbi:MAG TPA: DUF1848 family protein [bacterium]|nr:DUF1848 family protein [bacterium]
MNKTFLKVISASRREEMTGFAPDRLISLLETRCPPERVHTLVLWTKSPRNLLSHTRLNRLLKEFDQVTLHLTVTGMGGTPLEPGIPEPGRVLELLPDLVGFVGDPRRIAFRFDPIVHLILPDGRPYSNLNRLPEILPRVRAAGITDLIVSRMSAYPRVIRHLGECGLRLFPQTGEARQEEADHLRSLAAAAGMVLSGCCVPDWPASSCIDGPRLSALHPGHAIADRTKAAAQRPRCGCTKSWDIGWYMPCPGGCVYCYANPVIRTKREEMESWHPES